MATEIIIALLSLCGTCIGSLAGIMAANKLVMFRLEQLEKKVDKHNTLVERMGIAETKIENIEQEVFK